MNKRVLLRFLAAGLASAMLFAVAAPAGAVTIVLTDSGGSSADVIGTAGGALVLSNAYADTITQINGATVSIPLSFEMTVTSVGGVFVSAVGTKTIGDVATGQAILEFSLTSGIAFGSHLNMDGVITAVIMNALPGYDFSAMTNPGNAMVVAIAKTGTDFATILNDPTASAIGSGIGIEQSTTIIPEPTSLALLGISMSGFFAFRRFFKRTSVA